MAKEKGFIEIDYTDGDGIHSIWFSGKGIVLYLLDEEWNELVDAIKSVQE